VLDGVLVAYSGVSCASKAEVGCANAHTGAGQTETLTLQVTSGKTYWLGVAGGTAVSSGAYTLELDLP
jgi:hypothetical protein